MKKKEQLGMNPSTASHRLVKDLLWHHVASKVNCFKCGEPMSRETFSIEHKVPWMDSENPLELFFDIENVTFSHHSCNCASARQNPKTKFWEFVNPEGETVQFENLSKFARDNELCRKSLAAVNDGTYKQYLGWTKSNN